jgi:hypothetical protein
VVVMQRAAVDSVAASAVLIPASFVPRLERKGHHAAQVGGIIQRQSGGGSFRLLLLVGIGRIQRAEDSAFSSLRMSLCGQSSNLFCSYRNTLLLQIVFRPYKVQWSFRICSTVCFLVARIDSQARTAHIPSFSRI